VPENATTWPPGFSTRRHSAQNSGANAVSPVSHCWPMNPAEARAYSPSRSMAGADPGLPNRLTIETSA